ncbi:MAG: hypothetical protein RL637_1175 [Pseudomonadota bacterium]|jgi:hypothetical protein
MKKTLIVLNDVILLSIFKRWLSRAVKETELWFAKDTKKALEIVETVGIELIITELSLETESLEMMAELLAHYPQIKVAILLNIENSKYIEKCKKLFSVYFCQRPNSLKDFIRLLRVIEVIIFQAPKITDIQLIDWLQLIEYLNKTGIILVQDQFTQQIATLYFYEGIIYDALLADLNTTDSLLSLLNWSEIQLSFQKIDKKPLCQFGIPIAKWVGELIENLANPIPEQELKLDSPSSTIIPQSVIETATSYFEESQTIKSFSNPALKSQSLVILVQQMDLALLTPFYHLDCYSAFSIIDIEGNLLLNHQRIEEPMETNQLHQNSPLVMNTAMELIQFMQLGKLLFMQLVAEEGILQLSWIIEQQLVAIVLLTAEAKNTRLSHLYLEQIIHHIRQQIT